MRWIEGHHFPPLGVIFTLTAVYILLGTFFEEMSSILITLPLVLPIVVSLGYDPLWWGVICLIQVEMALIHPPMGIIVFLLHAIAPKIPMSTIYRGVVPFLVADFAVLIILILLPGIVLWLPQALHCAIQSGRVIAASGGALTNRGLYALRNRPAMAATAVARLRLWSKPTKSRSATGSPISAPDPDRNGHAGGFGIDFAILNCKALGANGIEKRADARSLASPWFSEIFECASISRMARRSLDEQKAR